MIRGGSAREAAAPPATREWWRSPFRMFQTNLREIDAGTLDVPATLDHLRDVGADVWLLSVGGILSNYPTALDCQSPNPALVRRESGDLVGDATRAAAAAGVRVMARMDFSKIDARRAERHPDWCFVGPDGTRQVYNGLTSVCPSGEYYQSHLFEVLEEVLTRYDVAGFFVNWLTFNEIDYGRRYRGVCQCVACHRRFARHAPGLTLPTGPESASYDSWRRFAFDTLEDLTARIREHLRRLAPDAALVQGDSADVVFHEANNAVGRPLWHHRTSDEVSAARSYRPGTPVLVNAVAFVDMPYRLASEDPWHMAQHLVQAIARGGVPSTYIMGSPGDIPYECLERAAEITRFHRDNADVYTDLVGAAPTLLVRPDALALDAGRFAGALEEYRGLHTMLVESRIPFDVVDGRHLARLAGEGAIGLDGRTVVVLPDLGTLDPPAIELLEGFARSGGTVVATGSTGLAVDETQLGDSPVARVLATLDTAEDLFSLHVRSSTDPSSGALPVVGAVWFVAARPDADTDLPGIGRAPFGPPEKCHGHLDTGHPGFLRRRAGDGSIAVFPWTIGRTFRETGLSALRTAFVRLVLETAPAVRLDGDAPEALELVLGRSVAGRVAHVLNRSGDRRGHFVPPVTVAPASVVLPWPGVTRVGARRTAVDLETRSVPGGVRVTLPAVELFEVLVGEEPSPVDA